MGQPTLHINIIRHIVAKFTSAVCLILFLFCTLFTDFNIEVVTKTTTTIKKSTKVKSNRKQNTDAKETCIKTTRASWISQGFEEIGLKAT